MMRLRLPFEARRSVLADGLRSPIKEVALALPAADAALTGATVGLDSEVDGA